MRICRPRCRTGSLCCGKLFELINEIEHSVSEQGTRTVRSRSSPDIELLGAQNQLRSAVQMDIACVGAE
jgi:hypothetical protein